MPETCSITQYLTCHHVPLIKNDLCAFGQHTQERNMNENMLHETNSSKIELAM